MRYAGLVAENFSQRRGDLLCQYRLRLRAGVDAIGLHQRRITGRNALEEAGQVVNPGFRADRRQRV